MNLPAGHVVHAMPSLLKELLEQIAQLLRPFAGAMVLRGQVVQVDCRFRVGVCLPVGHVVQKS